MANTADFISAVYDELAKSLQVGDPRQPIFLQMAWPGYALSPADFRRADAPNGAYDQDAARETFSALANIAPIFDRARFESSGFEVDDLYEIVLSSAIPAGATTETVGTNPIYRLFADAQYELMQAKRGAHDDPNAFYLPCSPTPADWYDEKAASSWATITLKQTDVKPATTATSTFARLGGVELAKQSVWRMKPAKGESSQLASRLQKSMKQPIERTLTPQALPSTATKSALTKSSLTKSSLARTLPASKAQDALLAAAKQRFAQPVSPTNMIGRSAFDVKRIDLQRQDLGINRVADRLRLRKLIESQLPTKPASPASDNFSVTFKFCRVNIERPWLKLALLSNPNWWMFNTPAGMYSTGSPDDNPGMFPLLATSLIVIRDLKITANWSPEDQANLGDAASFGFFDVRHGTVNSNTLEVKGLQVIGWVSKLMPKLPPLPPQ